MIRESGFWFASEDAVLEAVRPPKFRRTHSCSKTRYRQGIAGERSSAKSLLVAFF